MSETDYLRGVENTALKKTLELKEALKLEHSTCYYECLATNKKDMEEVTVIGHTNDSKTINLVHVLAARQLIASNGQCVLPESEEMKKYANYLNTQGLIDTSDKIVWVSKEDYLNTEAVFKAIKDKGYTKVRPYEQRPVYCATAQKAGLEMEWPSKNGTQINPGNKDTIRTIYGNEVRACPYPRILYTKNDDSWQVHKNGQFEDCILWEDEILDWFPNKQEYFKDAEAPRRYLMIQNVQGGGGIGNQVIYRDKNSTYYYKKTNENGNEFFEVINDLEEHIKNFVNISSSPRIEITPHLNPYGNNDKLFSTSINYLINEDGESHEITVFNKQLTNGEGDYMGGTSIRGTKGLYNDFCTKLTDISMDKLFIAFKNMNIHGWFGLDFHCFINPKTEDTELFVSEMNLRFTGISQFMRLLLNKKPEVFTRLMLGKIDYIDMDHVHLPENVTNLENLITMLKDLNIPIWHANENSNNGVIIKGYPHQRQVQLTFLGEQEQIIEWYKRIDNQNAIKFFPDSKTKS